MYIIKVCCELYMTVDSAHVRVMVEQMVGEVMEEGGLFGGEETVVDLVNGFLELSICLVVFARDVPAHT